MIGKITRTLARGVLQGLQLASVVAANRIRTEEKVYEKFTTSNLLMSQRMAERIQDGDKVLDVGTGSGRRLVELGLFRRIDRHGVDIHIRASRPGIELHTYDGRTLPFPDQSFDVVTICYVLHHLTPDHAHDLMGEITRVAKRKVLVLEDSMPEWTFAYRMRNRFHRMDADLQYGAESGAYVSPQGEAMFLTHDEWKQWFGKLSRVENVEIVSLNDVSKYAHHTLFAVNLTSGQTPES
jgi:ubiquinone/menaquinone biosynthesis C-methylase UbiE